MIRLRAGSMGSEVLVVHCARMRDRINHRIHQSLIMAFRIKSGEILHITDTFKPVDLGTARTARSRRIEAVLDGAPFDFLTITDLGVRPTGEIIVCGLRRGQVTVWELMTDRFLFTTPEFSPCIISTDARVLIYSTVDHQIVIWDLVEGRLLSTLSGHTAQIDVITLSLDREFIASHSIDGTIKIWGIPRYRIR